MAEILCNIIMSKVQDFCSKSNFFTLTADANEATKTGEEKELVFVKMLANGHQGFVPVNFLMKCQRL